MLIIGVFELDRALTFDRKLSNAVASAVDLVGREKDVSANLADVFEATEQILEPFPLTTVAVDMAVVQVNDAKEPEIVWSRRYDPGKKTKLSEGWTTAKFQSEIDVPDELLQPAEFIIVGRSVATHFPTFSTYFKSLTDISKFELSEVFFAKGRQVPCPEYNGNCATALSGS